MVQACAHTKPGSTLKIRNFSRLCFCVSMCVEKVYMLCEISETFIPSKNHLKIFFFFFLSFNRTILLPIVSE